jgi:MAE_28990/MAE_18760-like HEPN
MKVRTREDIEDLIAAELSWRKKELSILKLGIDKSVDKTRKLQPLIRSALLLLYAHWEGFVKLTGSAYAEYVNNKKLEFRELATPFQALAIRKQLKIPLKEFRQEHLVAITDFVATKQNQRCPLAVDKAVITANLDFNALKRIMRVLGLDVLPFQTKQFIIDDQLIHYRNNIAHGKDLELDYYRFTSLYREVIGFLQIFANQISNAVSNGAFKFTC